jgi:hypothetical protein
MNGHVETGCSDDHECCGICLASLTLQFFDNKLKYFSSFYVDVLFCNQTLEIVHSTVTNEVTLEKRQNPSS